LPIQLSCLFLIIFSIVVMLLNSLLRAFTTVRSSSSSKWDLELELE
jgi:hypothetical protein